MVCFEAFTAICSIIGMNIQDCHNILHSQLAWINLYVDKGTNIYKQVQLKQTQSCPCLHDEWVTPQYTTLNITDLGLSCPGAQF